MEGIAVAKAEGLMWLSNVRDEGGVTATLQEETE